MVRAKCAELVRTQPCASESRCLRISGRTGTRGAYNALYQIEGQERRRSCSCGQFTLS